MSIASSVFAGVGVAAAWPPPRALFRGGIVGLEICLGAFSAVGAFIGLLLKSMQVKERLNCCVERILLEMHSSKKSEGSKKTRARSFPQS